MKIYFHLAERLKYPKINMINKLRSEVNNKRKKVALLEKYSLAKPTRQLDHGFCAVESEWLRTVSAWIQWLWFEAIPNSDNTILGGLEVEVSGSKQCSLQHLQGWHMGLGWSSAG
jgi:hypothetical protein